MRYKGPGKHNTEDLEEIIEGLLDELNEKRIDDSFDGKLLDNLADLARELYSSCHVEPDSEDKASDICKNLKRYLEEFSRDNNFSLS